MAFDPEAFIEKQVRLLRDEIGNEKAFAATSGGVDSTVSAMLAHKAIGKRAIVAFLDDGLMREGEPEDVVSKLKGIGLNAKLYRVQEPFFKALKGITDPEEKRRAFRRTFLRHAHAHCEGGGREVLHPRHYRGRRR